MLRCVSRGWRGLPITIGGLLIFCVATAVLLAQGNEGAKPTQSSQDPRLNLNSGQAIYEAGCAGCHGPNGQGMPDTTVGFEKPGTFPNFTECDQTTPEYDADWKATIRDGGHARGFSPIMPAFGDALTLDQIDAVVKYVRGFCRDEAWPRGELNLPRALTTEKAYPEDEMVVTTAVSTQLSHDVSNAIVYEHRLGKRNQVELSVPFNFVHDSAGAVTGGVGDIGLGVKRVLVSSLRTGSIVSAQGEIILPTGSKTDGLGTGVTVFETFAAYGQLLPFNGFLQLQAGTDQPTRTDNTPRSVFGRLAVGKSFREDEGLGRLWSPMLEILANRELRDTAKTNLDLVPQFQVTLSQRQHVRANAGLQVPVTNTAGRSVQLVFYVLWDWFDGGLFEGWR
jgi:mono/diheme cytochrome c family protein